MSVMGHFLSVNSQNRRFGSLNPLRVIDQQYQPKTIYFHITVIGWIFYAGGLLLFSSLERSSFQFILQDAVNLLRSYDLLFFQIPSGQVHQERP